MTVPLARWRSVVRTGFVFSTAIVAMLALAAPAGAASKYLKASSYPGMSTFQCRTDAITIYPGQNLNLYGQTQTCPNAKKVSGPGSASIFSTPANGFVTRFEPSMVEIKPSGKLVTPSVWDLHLHHVVWLAPSGGPTFASGEEKTIASQPKGYGLPVKANANWGLNYMLHNLGASKNRQVYITWEIDWVPQTSPARTDIQPTQVHWLDTANAHIYPVFDAAKEYDLNGDGKYVFPDEALAATPSDPGYSERQNVGGGRKWTLTKPETLVFAAGHLHPGGKHVDITVTRNGETRRLFTSRAHYYEPAGAVSWDVSMTATPRDWRVSLKAGDTVSVSVTYDVSKSSWYESMGIMPLSYSDAADPKAMDPFDDATAFDAMRNEGGTLTHGRLKENIDSKARKNLKLPNPQKLGKGVPLPAGGVEIDSFLFSPGGFTAQKDFPTSLMRPTTIDTGQSVTFTNTEAMFSNPAAPDNQQVWHTITSCKAPCNRGSGIGYPLAGGRVPFDSGQLGYGTDFTAADNGGYNINASVTNASDTYTTPKFNKPGTYTYFCRLHPLMRGSIRVVGPNKLSG
ncbi:hypothetical protein BH10ACT11_BH10ACT11_08340 [soil metagenome]